MVAPMAPFAPVARAATLTDWLAQSEDARLELIDGELVPKAAPSFAHGLAQASTAAALAGTFGRRASAGLGGWWLGTEIDLVLDGRGYRPDLVGWRRDRIGEQPRERPVIARPDWLGEVVSESNRAIDTVVKLARYHQAGVPHYWIIDPEHRTLTVYRLGAEGYVVALTAGKTERGHAPPFVEIELSVGELNEVVGLSQSAMSQHLAVLRRDELVATRKEAQTVY